MSFTSFPIWIPFISFSSLIAVSKTSNVEVTTTMLNSSGESGHPCLVPDLRGNAFNFSPLRIMFAVGLSYVAFVMLRYVPSMPAFRTDLTAADTGQNAAVKFRSDPFFNGFFRQNSGGSRL